MALDFPSSPILGQVHQNYIYDGEKWVAQGTTSAAVRYDIAQGLTANQQAQARANIGSLIANVVINGDFRINQGNQGDYLGGYVSGAVLAAGTYGHDQWKAGAGGGDYSFTQLKSSTQITIASGKSLIQPIEDVRVAGGSYVLTWTGTARARAGIDTLTPSGTYVVSPLLISGQTAGTMMSVEFNAGTLGAVKLELGTVATPFVMTDYANELIACQRYYQRISIYRLWSTHTASWRDDTSYILPVVMRALPTMNWSTSGSGNLGVFELLAQDYNCISIRTTASAGSAFTYWSGTAFMDARL